MMKLLLSRIELKFGLIFLVMLESQYLIMFMIMIITMKDWMQLFVVGIEKKFVREEN